MMKAKATSRVSMTKVTPAAVMKPTARPAAPKAKSSVPPKPAAKGAVSQAVAEASVAQYPPKVQFILEVLDDMKAIEVDVYSVENKMVLTDYFVICSGSSSTHTGALAGEVHKRCKTKGWMLGRLEGDDNPSWKILDYGEVVLHVFLPETRAYYRLEEIWGEGRPEATPEDVGPVIEKLLKHPRAGGGATSALKKRRGTAKPAARPARVAKPKGRAIGAR